MAQGIIKKTTKPSGGAPKRPPSKTTKPGPRQVAPKKIALIKQKKLNKKLSSGLVAKTERTLAQKAGHLEILAGGKKSKAKAGDNKGGQKK
ncbi:hypothetical protein N7474_004035 [Penicillium riverlandense]|uniref:uncharacterized protein n=1 Tax=Penicillium riverlandense TaxID=1903569 RepID=UPI002546A928|nr:uncharacterized protein N7474_004035 [Penicillium riverlandense]KAJ5818444.1 hypothetical protein N7474_004035 [Penicillium riverlandense]